MPTTSSQRSAGKLIIMPKSGVDTHRPISTQNPELSTAVLPRLSSGETRGRIRSTVQFAIAYVACPNCGAQRGQDCPPIICPDGRKFKCTHTGRLSEAAQLRRSNRKLYRDFRKSLLQAMTSTAHTKTTPAQNVEKVTAIRPAPTRDSELRAAVLELVRCPNPVMDGLRIRETLKIVGFDVAQTEVLSVLQHLHDHGYITCEETLRPFVPLSDLARLSRIEITAEGCGLVEDQQMV